eukprot:scaffold8271_cov72-Skeletonema_dohrnii-CCMP3373.AAC.1
MDESLMLRHFGLDAPSFVLSDLALDAAGLFAVAAAPLNIITSPQMKCRSHAVGRYSWRWATIE